ncbi:MAG: hypothetical protein ABI460_21565, partial [Caldimonas sp.]
MDSRFAVVGRASVRISPPAQMSPHRRPEVFAAGAASGHTVGGGSSARRPLRPSLWLAAFAVALWPHWRWAAARLADGSDDPLGLAALAVLLLCVVRLAPRLRNEPAPAWLAAAVL